MHGIPTINAVINTKGAKGIRKIRTPNTKIHTIDVIKYNAMPKKIVIQPTNMDMVNISS